MFASKSLNSYFCNNSIAIIQIRSPWASTGSIRRLEQGEWPRFHHCWCCYWGDHQAFNQASYRNPCHWGIWTLNSLFNASFFLKLDIDTYCWIGTSRVQSCNLVWELRVLGWDVTYGAEFVPGAEDGYTVIVQKARKLIATDEPVVKNSFKTGDTGKIVLTIDNTTSKKKKLLYRYKIKTSTESI